MRKWLVFVLLVFVLLTGAIYLFIPNSVTLRQEATLRVNANAFSRTISDKEYWQRWWPNNTTTITAGKPSHHFTLNGNDYFVLGGGTTSRVIAVHYGKDSLLTTMYFTPVSNDSITVKWTAGTGTSYLPVTRLRRYFALKNMAKDWALIFQKMTQFYTNDTRVYNALIRTEKVTDSNLVTTIMHLDAPPTIDTVYRIIDELKIFAGKKGARQTNSPMLNITKMTDGNDRKFYRTQVALPIDTKLNNEGKFQYRWMLGGGKILMTEVKGGPATIDNAFQVLENYLSDHNLVAPAIPFQSLITDRRNEPDTSKWITKINWPVM